MNLFFKRINKYSYLNNKDTLDIVINSGYIPNNKMNKHYIFVRYYVNMKNDLNILLYITIPFIYDK